ncbi:hypothetical protein [Erythrobacter sp. CCH5-A1]|jgi:hypothetical protein|uniref:hypothetical protein n=1 Tax=Erythrobacter sp. CCH5-A1 TaxID=1768792 RepID=UPI0008307C01|nr:hypothetical protein [Erythrobacter sp. CCH5-A1]
MLKKIIGAAIGAKLAKNSPAVGGATGAALGAAVPFVLSRISLPTMVMLGVGGYFAKRWFDQQPQREDTQPAPALPAPAPATNPVPVQTHDLP